MSSLLFAAVLAAAAAQSPAPAAEPAPVAVEAPAAPAASGELRAPAGTVVVVELTEMVASDKHPRGHRFDLRLAQPLEVDGVVLLPAGTPGKGEVVFSARRGMAGKPGELTVAARFLTFEGKSVPLKAMKLGKAGVDQGDAAFLMSMAVAPLGFFVQGGEVVLPPGTVATAKLAADFVAPAPTAAPTAAPAAAPAASEPAPAVPAAPAA